MRPSEISTDRVILIPGSPRSGASRFAKILDLHPGVLDRHERDTVLRDDDLPSMCRPEQALRDAPPGEARALFAFARLDWDSQSASIYLSLSQ